MDPFSILGIGLAVGKSIFGFFGADEENRALDEKETENRIAANNQTIQRERSLQKMVGGQIAQSAASGITPSSGSLQAIQTDTFNLAAEDQELANLQLDVENENIEQQKRNNKEKAWINTFDNIFSAAKFLGGQPDVGEQPEGFDIFGSSSSLAGSFREKAKSPFGGSE